MRLPNVKMLLRWPSRMHIFDSIDPSLMRGYQRTLPSYHAFVIDMVFAIGAEIPALSKSRCLL